MFDFQRDTPWFSWKAVFTAISWTAVVLDYELYNNYDKHHRTSYKLNRVQSCHSPNIMDTAIIHTTISTPTFTKTSHTQELYSVRPRQHKGQDAVVPHCIQWNRWGTFSIFWGVCGTDEGPSPHSGASVKYKQCNARRMVSQPAAKHHCLLTTIKLHVM